MAGRRPSQDHYRNEWEDYKPDPDLDRYKAKANAVVHEEKDVVESNEGWTS